MGLQISLRLISFRRHISDARLWISCLNNVYIHRLEITFTPKVHRITEKTTSIICDCLYGKPFYYLLCKIDILYVISDILYRI